nr:hypothetical protein [Tanacetum cinerariifolium]
YQQMKEKNADMYEKMTRFMEDMRRVSEANTTPIIADQHFGVSDISGFQSYQHMYSWVQILIRERIENANWTLAKSGTLCLHPENNRFMILTDPHNIGTLNGLVRLFPSWIDVTWVYMPIKAEGVHWVTGAINLIDSIFYVFDSMESESRMLMLEQQVPQQKIAKDCEVITCWLITKLCLGQAPTVVNDSQVYWDNMGHYMSDTFYKCRCEDTENCGY